MSDEDYLEYIEKWKIENKELIDSGKCRKVFLNYIPTLRENKGKRFNWMKSIDLTLYFIYKDVKAWIKITKYDYKTRKLTVKYNNKTFEILTGNFQKCELGTILGKLTSDFKIEIGEIFKDNKRDIMITDKKKIQDKTGRERKYYRYTCNKCSFDGGIHWNIKTKEYKEELWIEENHLLGDNRGGCACCNGKVVVENINSIVITCPWMVKYFQGGYDEAKMYTPCSNQHFNPICPDCGRVRNKSISINDIYRNDSINCSCKDGVSYPNKVMFNVLSQLDIKFTTEYSPEWIKPKRYDFYFNLSNKKYILEMDGYFHSNYNSMSNQTADESKAIDNYKDSQARLHGIEVIRIDCNYGNNDRFDYIKQDIVDKLNKLFDLSVIDWNSCGEYALNNLVKLACEYKMNNPNLTTGDISNIMGYCSGTILKWLKQGAEINLCFYNSKIEKSKSSSKAGKASGKQVEIFKDEISLGVFPSAKELQRQSEKLFGASLLISKISNVCNSKRKTHKGYTFKYV